ncbi:MAG: DUF1847 domain-containing protein [Oscillospiraceae bacterium]|nr:DUF1847 domain-containing protein [Oscillospiraceae bacterium]
MPYCAECKNQPCRYGKELENTPKGCPSVDMPHEVTLARYSEEEKMMSREAALVESHGYGQLTRIEEIMDYSIRCGYKKLGIAFCVGFSGEAATLSKIFRENGFEVESVCCKNGEVPKPMMGVERKDWLRPENDIEIMCNPAGQAAAMNASDVDMVVILGLCVGHDTIFMKHCEKPMTYGVVKDRKLGHNPAAALYCSDSYLRGIHKFRENYWPDGKEKNAR